MNNNEGVNKPEAPLDNAETTGGPRTRVTIIIIVAIFAIVAVSLTAWLMWPARAGKPVPAPRNVSFTEPTAAPATAARGDQVLTLSSDQVQSGLVFGVVGEQPTAEGAGQAATGVVQANSYKETPVVSLVAGIVRSVRAELGQHIGRGQSLVVISSNELADVQARYLAALAALDEHHRHHERTAKLVEIGAASREELETSNTQYREAESNLANLRQKLVLLGLSANRIASLNSSTQISSEVVVPAPSSGTLTGRSVNPGEVVEANKELLRITDLSTVWVVGQVYQKDLATVRVGTGANVTSEAYPGKVLRGRVSYVDPRVDAATRTSQVRVELANPGQMLKIGMYVNIAFGSTPAAEKTMPVVPRDAVQMLGDQTVVFVPGASANEFILRPVKLGPETNGFFPVWDGLSAGDRIVVAGSFMLRAEWLKTHSVS